ncbi:MAG: uL15 family ribosomal protein, partial [Candidatus Aenigmatarchaeota archaeon]
KKKHRGAGSRGGRGKAGMLKHKKSWMIKYEPDHFGKRGFKSVQRKEIKCINLYELEELARKNNLKEINISNFGYEKVLGSGKITIPVIVKANLFSKKAKDKIEAVGGKIVQG